MVAFGFVFIGVFLVFHARSILSIARLLHMTPPISTTAKPPTHRATSPKKNKKKKKKKKKKTYHKHPL